MNHWLKCEASAGMFSSEFAVKGHQFDGKGFSLFALEDEVKMESLPNGHAIPALLRITPLKTKDDLILIALPRPSLEGGQEVTVKSNQLSNG